MKTQFNELKWNYTYPSPGFSIKYGIWASFRNISDPAVLVLNKSITPKNLPLLFTGNICLLELEHFAHELTCLQHLRNILVLHCAVIILTSSSLVQSHWASSAHTSSSHLTSWSSLQLCMITQPFMLPKKRTCSQCHNINDYRIMEVLWIHHQSLLP